MLEPPPGQTAGPAVRPAGRPAAALSPPSPRVAAVSGRPPHNPAKTGYRVPTSDWTCDLSLHENKTNGEES